MIRRARRSSRSIDELAHTNAPGTRNEKRYEDIDEILEAGIDVISTVNVQHLESLNDTIFELTDVRVRETFPDRVLDEADEVVLVDLTPEALQERLARGQGLPAGSGRGRAASTSSASTTSARCASSPCARSPRTSKRAASGRRPRPAQPAGGRGACSRAGHAGAEVAAASCGAPGARRSGSAPSSTRSGCDRPAPGADRRGADPARRAAPARA